MITDTNIAAGLQLLGLSDKETIVYEACLQRGEISVVELARLSSLSRSTAYFVADELVKKGLLRFVQKGAHRIYSVEDPRKIELLLDQERIKLNQKAATFSAILPTLSMKYMGVARKPVVSYYTGQQEMRQLFEDALLSDIDELLFVGSINVLLEAVGREYLATWNRRKVKGGIKTRGIWPSNEETQEPYLQPTSLNMRQVRYAPSGFVSPTYILLYANKVAFLSSVVEAYGVLIESEDLSVSMRSWFNTLWKDSSTKKVNL